MVDNTILHQSKPELCFNVATIVNWKTDTSGTAIKEHMGPMSWVEQCSPPPHI